MQANSGEIGYVGVDVGADRLHCVAVDAARRVTGVRIFRADEVDDLVDAVRSAHVVAVDAPAQLSTMPHEHEVGLSPKFRRGRCAEIALGREHGSWVPWVAPAERPARGWIETGLRACEALRNGGTRADVIEVFPYAGFRALAAGARLPKKQTVAGRRARAALLASAGVGERDLHAWSHDELDALLAAVIAVDVAENRAVRVSCGHDDSAIWLPAPAKGEASEPRDTTG
jgi:predicted nuclease with RNAse H fold